MQPVLDRVSTILGAPRAVTVSAEGLLRWFEIFRILQGAEVRLQLGEWSDRVQPTMGPGVRDRMQWTTTISEGALAQARTARDVVRKRMDALLADHAVLVLPTVPDIAPLRDTSAAAPDDFRARMMSLLCIASLAGLPQVSLPLATFQGCPLGVSLIAARGEDLLLLALARRIAG